VLLCSAASAQQQIQAKKVLGPVKDAGTYHVATGTWTRGAQQSNISPDYIYRNDYNSGYFGTGWEGCWTIDEIILPGTGSPKGGSQDAYNVDGFDFSYCSQSAAPIDFYFGYWNSYQACEDPTSPATCLDENTTGFLVAGLPSGGGCWIVTLDLAGGYEVCLSADGGVCAPGYDGGGQGLDGAGLGFGWTTTDGGITGPFLNGDPNWIPAGDGTCYNPGFGNACFQTQASGLGIQDLFSITNYDFGGAGVFTACGLGNGCYFFGGYTNNNGCGTASNTPIGQFGINLFADCNAACGDVFTEYCDESQNPNNIANIGVSGNSLSGPDIIVSASGVNGPFGYLLVSASNGTVSNPPGAKGDLCLVGTTIGRYVKDIQPGPGTISTNLNTNNTTGSGYNLPSTIGGSYAANATWNFQYWHRQPMGAPASFSSAASVTFSN
jgi:hypothetical protein